MNSTSSSSWIMPVSTTWHNPGRNNRLSPHIGPYDIFPSNTVRWYGKGNPEEEKDLLYDFLSRHTDRLYKYSERRMYVMP
jgi:hypothetical protein